MMLTPFLKWAGGKRWLVNSGQLPVPSAYKRYIEPFLGSGAVFFCLNPHSAILSDLNKDLIELYLVMRDKPKNLHAALFTHHKNHNKCYYYEIRSNIPSSSVDRAARTLYLNRTCWNGLYRVNLSGQFNVPIGTKTSVILPHENFQNFSEALKRTEIYCHDFEKTIDQSSEGDFLFVDPPYTVKHNLNGFLKYNENIFSWPDQIRLSSSVKRAIQRGVSVAVTNADHESVRSLYSGHCKYRKLHRHSILSSIASKRVPTTEALFFANL
ncbi:Dam family site-specific DNA-(adenine-N6)-methyltransferase [Acidisoma cellulosilytica]|uniref:site-specific DNA-methyltransferase (adenine-specific) n=1 Tax=Acidisoma cellulosilyticum TaxID=2802395 RepID=A0A963Z373_9PROT|nr:Dam family site-specific DNA-(adenine-N6)-methyltransferase [Acidisoma cellulosilyticum]MCB8881950.1 Dam family site-specific DNA-(adenine-N6)-methyltransferase [Acidisoma cellulosilyticum]